ncbi:Glucan endo-1 3-beta-D-glucosidase [uncultured Paludibacter sp.]|nr:Glucan endo-1 3-beta-D-glucosidase [uncultured Paludibacter sp.]
MRNYFTMKTNMTTLLLFFTILLNYGCKSATDKVAPPEEEPVVSTEVGTGETDGYKLVWEDLFNDNELNSKYWTPEVNGNGGGNNELQYYRSENISVGKDPNSDANCLIITGKKESYLNKACTSGRLITKDKVNFKYGKLEARIKLPKTADGLWPAFWMMGNDISTVGWPRCGETDVLEMGNSNGIKNGTQDRYFNGACHWGESWENHPMSAKASTNSYSLQDDFHLYTLIWNADSIKMYLDKDKYPDVTPYFTLDIKNENLNKPGHYFKKPNFILFNLAIGGDFTGIWDINKVTALNNGDVYMYVDFVKIYQKEDEGQEFKLYQ